MLQRWRQELRRRLRWWGRPAQVLGAFALVVFPLALASCKDRDTVVNAASRPAVAAPVMLGMRDLLANPLVYTNQPVSVASEVHEVLGPKAFTLGGDGFLPPGEILVVVPGGLPAVPERSGGGLAPRDIVQVAGTVRAFARAEMARETGDPLEGAAYAAWEGKPAIVASALQLTPRGTNAAAEAPLTDLSAITGASARETLAGRRVELRDVVVQEVVADRAFWITAPEVGQRLFVAAADAPSGTAPTPAPAVHLGETVSVSGTLQRAPLPDDARKQWGLSAVEAEPLGEEILFLSADSVQAAP